MPIDDSLSSFLAEFSNSYWGELKDADRVNIERYQMIGCCKTIEIRIEGGNSVINMKYHHTRIYETLELRHTVMFVIYLILSQIHQLIFKPFWSEEIDYPFFPSLSTVLPLYRQLMCSTVKYLF